MKKKYDISITGEPKVLADLWAILNRKEIGFFAEVNKKGVKKIAISSRTCKLISEKIIK